MLLANNSVLIFMNWTTVGGLIFTCVTIDLLQVDSSRSKDLNLLALYFSTVLISDVSIWTKLKIGLTFQRSVAFKLVR